MRLAAIYTDKLLNYLVINRLLIRCKTVRNLSLNVATVKIINCDKRSFGGRRLFMDIMCSSRRSTNVSIKHSDDNDKSLSDHCLKTFEIFGKLSTCCSLNITTIFRPIVGKLESTS